MSPCSDAADIYKKELNDIRSSIQNDSSKVFFVNIFGAPFPLPTRYELVNGMGETGRTLKFSSPVFFRSNYETYFQKSIDFAGTITLGKYQDYLESADDLGTSALELLEEESMYGLRIKVFKPNKNMKESLKIKEGELSIVLIHNDNDYISIVDRNPGLWKTLVSEYGRVNNVSK